MACQNWPQDAPHPNPFVYMSQTCGEVIVTTNQETCGTCTQCVRAHEDLIAATQEICPPAL